MSDRIERELPSGIHVIERRTRTYTSVTLNATPAQYTQENGGTYSFGIILADFPKGHVVRAVFVDLVVGNVFNASAATNYLDRGGAGNLALLHPWQVRKAPSGSWMTCGNCRTFDFYEPGLATESGFFHRPGEIDVKGVIDDNAGYEFRLGDTAGGLGWASVAASLYPALFHFNVRIEVV